MVIFILGIKIGIVMVVVILMYDDNLVMLMFTLRTESKNRS